MDIEITDFKNFAQFLAYNRQHADDMKNWSPEQLKRYCDKVMELREKDSNFKEQYDKWQKMIELKQKCHVTIGGTPKETASSQAWLALKKAQEKLGKKMQIIKISRISFLSNIRKNSLLFRGLRRIFFL